MNDAELEFLLRHVGPRDCVWEWGSGRSTAIIAARAGRVVTVEHSARYALMASALALPNLSVLHVPTDLPYDAAKELDGDAETFASYVDAYTGKGVDVVVIDGRARVACARRVAETAPFGPTPAMRIFLHDCDRVDYRYIFNDQGEEWAAYFKPLDRVGSLLRMEMR